MSENEKRWLVIFWENLMPSNRLWNINSLMRAFCGVVIVLCFPLQSFAHAIILEAIPAPNATVSGPDVQIILKFNSRIDGTRSRLTLVQPDKTTHSVDIEKQDSPDKLKARVAGLATGVYVLRWQVLAADGHISRGEIPFKIK
jgi:hypothetical protein